MAPRLIAVVLALWGLVLTAGLLTDRWPATLFTHAHRGQDGPGDADAPPRTPAPQTEGTRVDGARPAGDALVPMTPRFIVCDGATGGARMALHRPGGAPLLAVHCGSRAVWLGFVPTSGGTEPRLEASLELPARAAEARGRPLTMLAAQLQGDDRADLVVGFRHVDGAGSPVGGGVAILGRPAEGGLQAPRRLVGEVPLSLVHGRFDEGGPALGVLSAGDRRVAGTHALRILSAEPAPKKTVEMDVDDAHAAVAVDLNLDGRDDVVVGGTRRSVAWWLSGGEAALQGHAVGPVRETVAGDLSGDGKPDALIVGNGLWALRASSEGAFSPAAIESTQCKGEACMRDVHLADVDADGKPDIVGYVHPGVRTLLNRGGLRFESRPLSRVEGDAMSILQALVADVGGDGRVDLLLLGHVKGSPDAIELAIVDDVRSHELVRLGGDPAPTPTGPLAARYTLR